MAKQGKVVNELLHKLNSIDYYNLSPPKSLGREWVDEIFLPLLRNNKYSTTDILRTIIEHIAMQVAKSAGNNATSDMLITGGGAYNDTLIHVIKSKIRNKIYLPDIKTIEFKEAMVFAFLGVLRIRNEQLSCICYRCK